MVNAEAFTKRLQQILTYYGETGSSFAEKIGVQRSSISHILSGRNKPSLDFIMKTLNAYPEVDIYWLLNGKGEFPSEEKQSVKHINLQETLFNKTPETIKNQELANSPTPPINNASSFDENLQIEQIVIFYNNGSFKRYKP